MVGRPLLTPVSVLFQLIPNWRRRVGLTRRSSGPMTIWAILASPWLITWWWWWIPSITLPTSQPPVQVIYLLLQLLCLLIVWDMTNCPWMTPLNTICVVGLYHNAWGALPISHSLQVNKLVLPLRANLFFPILAYISHDSSRQLHSTLMFPQTAPIVGT